MYILRDYQKEAVQKMDAAMPGKHALVLPPGSGKTVVLANYVSQLKDMSILIIVHRDELVSQTFEKLKTYGVKAGLEKGTSRTSLKDLQLLTEKIEKKKARCEARIQKTTEIIAGIPEEKEKIQKNIDERLEKNKVLIEERDEIIEKLKKVLPEKSSEFQQQKDQILKKYKREEASVYRLYKKLNTGIVMKASAATFSKKSNSEKLKELKAIKPEPPTIVVASVQSLHEERLKLWKDDTFDIIIFDEAHHLRAPTWAAISNYFNPSHQFGFSATWKPKENDFNLLFARDIMTMLEEGWLVKPEYHKIDVREQKTLPDSPEHDTILLNILKTNALEKVIVFCASVDQAYRLQPSIPNSFALTCDTSEKDRRLAIENFKKGTLMVLFNYQIVYEGFDDPGATMILAKATPDDNVYLQASGRGFRPNAWKNSVKIFDIIMKDTQSTLPTIFGLHKDWVFEDTPFEDAKKAIAFAKKHELHLKSYPNWGFLKLKKTPEAFRKKNRPRTSYKDVLGGNIAITSYGKKYAKGVGFGGNNFYSPEQALSLVLNEKIKKDLNFKPIKVLDPTTLCNNKVAMDPIALKRMRVAIYIRDYWEYNSFLKQMRFTIRKHPLTESQCDVVLRIGEEIEEELSTPINEVTCLTK